MENKTNSVEKARKFKLPEKVVNGLYTGATVAGFAAMAMPMAFAAGSSAADMVKAITTLVKYIGILLGIVYGIFGFLHYAAANAEGDGPGKNKAQNQLAAAVMLVAIGVIVSLVNWESILPSDI